MTQEPKQLDTNINFTPLGSINLYSAML
ncbi:uncharacterized protein METZ01_LOCUS110777 [marine metagenome]|uniref:Uncharacterized protein n=1 Tax=marine metagenome TaxID=408172 RepID=A0A381X122_9ZZZZ